MKCEVRLPNDGSAAFPLSALFRALRFPTAASVAFLPAPPSACALLASPLCRACPLRLSGRSRSVVCSSALVRGRGFASLALFPLRSNRAPSNEFSANDGGDAVGEAAQNRARRFSFKRAWRKNCRARFTARCLAATSLRSCARPSVCATSLRIAALRLIYGAFAAGVAPDPMRRGQFRAQPTACPAWSAPRAAYAYRLRLFSPDGENRSPRWGRLRDTTTDDNGTRGGAVGCCSAWRFAKAGSAAKPQTQRPRQNGVRGLWGIGASLQAKRG